MGTKHRMSHQHECLVFRVLGVQSAFFGPLGGVDSHTDQAPWGQSVTSPPSSGRAHEVSEFKEIDILILNAGMSMGCYFEDIKDLADGDFMLSLNVMGVANVLHYAFPFIPKVRGSRIVVISSIAGAIGVPFRTLYCASKWAVNGFCASLRTELEEAYGENAPKVVVSCPPEVDGDGFFGVFVSFEQKVT